MGALSIFKKICQKSIPLADTVYFLFVISISFLQKYKNTRYIYKYKITKISKPKTETYQQDVQDGNILDISPRLKVVH